MRGYGVFFFLCLLHNNHMNVLQEIFTDYYEEIKYTLHPRKCEMDNIDKMIHCGELKYVPFAVHGLRTFQPVLCICYLPLVICLYLFCLRRPVQTLQDFLCIKEQLQVHPQGSFHRCLQVLHFDFLLSAELFAILYLFVFMKMDCLYLVIPKTVTPN